MIRISFLLLLLSGFTSHAEGLQYVPKWHMYNNEACYAFDDAKKLLEVDLQLTNCEKRTELQLVQIQELKVALTETQEALRLSKLETVNWQKQSEEFENEYRKKIIELKESEVKRYSNTSYYVIGGVVVFVGGVVVGLLVH
jgi:hypothetical protein